jgi:hypothetical protein
MIEASQKMIGQQNNPAVNRYFSYRLILFKKLLEGCRQVGMAFESKETTKEEAMHIEDTERLVTEIEMLKVVFYLVARKMSGTS